MAGAVRTEDRSVVRQTSMLKAAREVIMDKRTFALSILLVFLASQLGQLGINLRQTLS